MHFLHKTAVITGAASGLGRAFAIALAQRGARLALVDRQDCRDTANAIMALGGEVQYWQCDVADEQQVTAVTDAICASYPSVELLLLCAGIHQSCPFEKLTLANWRRQIDVDLTGSFLWCQALWHGMRQHSYGRVLILTGASGLFGDLCESAFASAKMALMGLVNCLSLEGLSYNIRANTLCPQALTAMTHSHLAQTVGPMFSCNTPVAAALYLLGENAPTGQHLLAAAGSVSRVRLAETEPGYFSSDGCTPERLAKSWPRLSCAKPFSFQGSGEEQIIKWAKRASREHGVVLE